MQGMLTEEWLWGCMDIGLVPESTDGWDGVQSFRLDTENAGRLSSTQSRRTYILCRSTDGSGKT